MFHVKDGLLSYLPFKTYKLPDIVEIPRETATFVDRKTMSTLFERPIYRLRWPGEMDGKSDAKDIRIPLSVIRNWGTLTESELAEAGAPVFDNGFVTARFKEPANGGKKRINIGGSDEEFKAQIKEFEVRKPEAVRDLLIHPDPGYPLDKLVQDRKRPQELPDVLAYHLAVNQTHYAPLAGVLRPISGIWPVAGMPARVVQEILQSRFAFDREALPALAYLKWLAETHRPHPLLTGFDTNVREMLLGINHEAVRMFFRLAYDYQYSPVQKWWAKEEYDLDPRFATYLHGVGRASPALYARLAGLEPPLNKEDVAKLLAHGFRSGLTANPVPDDVKARMDEWARIQQAPKQDTGYKNALGKAPCVWKTVEDVAKGLKLPTIDLAAMAYVPIDVAAKHGVLAFAFEESHGEGRAHLLALIADDTKASDADVAEDIQVLTGFPVILTRHYGNRLRDAIRFCYAEGTGVTLDLPKPAQVGIGPHRRIVDVTPGARRVDPKVLVEALGAVPMSSKEAAEKGLINPLRHGHLAEPLKEFSAEVFDNLGKDFRDEILLGEEGEEMLQTHGEATDSLMVEFPELSEDMDDLGEELSDYYGKQNQERLKEFAKGLRLKKAAKGLRVKEIDLQAARLIPEEIARRYKCVGVRLDEHDHLVGFIADSPKGYGYTDIKKDLFIVAGHLTDLRGPTWKNHEKDILRAIEAVYTKD